MPAQPGLGAAQMQCLPVAAGQAGKDEQQHTVIAVQPRSLTSTLQHDDLLTEQGVLGKVVRPRMGEVTGRARHQPGRQACWRQQTLERPGENDDPGR